MEGVPAKWGCSRQRSGSTDVGEVAVLGVSEVSAQGGRASMWHKCPWGLAVPKRWWNANLCP